jgi:hypothetical protein
MDTMIAAARQEGYGPESEPAAHYAQGAASLGQSQSKPAHACGDDLSPTNVEQTWSTATMPTASNCTGPRSTAANCATRPADSP